MSAVATASGEYNNTSSSNGDCGDGLKGNTAAPSILRRIIVSYSPCHGGGSSSSLCCGGGSSSSSCSSVLSTYVPPVSPRVRTFVTDWLRPVSVSVASLVCLPLAFYTREAGTLPYEIKGGTFREIVIGWDALLHISIWPIVVLVSAVGFVLAHCDRKGCSAYGCASIGGGSRLLCGGSHQHGGTTTRSARKAEQLPQMAVAVGGGNGQSQAAAVAAGPIRTLCDTVASRWPLGMIGTYVVLLSIVFSLGSVVHSNLQVVSPHWVWNPLLWLSGYQVYYPDGIQAELSNLCIDGGSGNDGSGDGSTKPHDDFGTVAPLCLSESSWRILSAEGLTSRNADDVETVLRGVRYARQPDHGMVVNIMSRDTVDAIGPLRQNIEGLIPFFNKVAVVVFENDSRDGSRDAFKAWADDVRDKGGEYVVDVMECDDAKDCVFGEGHRDIPPDSVDYSKSSAIGRMGEFRQRIVDYILDSETYADYSHMMVLDLDLKVSLSPLGVLHTLGKVPDAAVASSGRQVWPGSFGSFVNPYDFSAFRALRSPRNARLLDLHRDFCHLKPPGDRWRNQCDAVSPFFLMVALGHDWTSGPEPYPVASAFNGATLYPLSLVRSSGAKYDAGSDGQRCEHIGFNKSLKRPMYVNPKWDMHLDPRIPGGPTGPRALKTLNAVVFTPKISLSIFFQSFGCMMLFVHSVLILVMKVLYPGWSKIMRGAKMNYHVLPRAGGRTGLKNGAGGGKVVDMDYLIGGGGRPQSPPRKKRSSSDYGVANSV